jgi:hypothetical protein
VADLGRDLPMAIVTGWSVRRTVTARNRARHPARRLGTPEVPMTMSQRLVIWRAERHLRRAARRRGRELWRELAVYSTQAERDDLLATFEAYPESLTGEYRDILQRQAVQALRTSRGWPGAQPR